MNETVANGCMWLQDGDLDRATPEKLRLEEKQREARKHPQGAPCCQCMYAKRTVVEADAAAVSNQ